MMFTKPNAKKNSRLPWKRKKAPTKLQIALAMIQGVRNHNRKARKNDGR